MKFDQYRIQPENTRLQAIRPCTHCCPVFSAYARIDANRPTARRNWLFQPMVFNHSSGSMPSRSRIGGVSCLYDHAYPAGFLFQPSQPGVIKSVPSTHYPACCQY